MLAVSPQPAALRRVSSRTARRPPVRIVRAAAVTPAGDLADCARAAGLRYTSDTRPGIRRRKNGSGFIYFAVDGTPLRDSAELARIRKLVIPPAWRDVRVCPDSRGHLQATGRDARGRKQYRYHPRWREVRDETKYYRMLAFAQTLPAIRRRTDADLRKPGLPREKVLAAVVQLLEKTLIRVGNDEYAKQNRSFGLTTLRNGHVEVNGRRVRFSFRGKSGVEHEVDLEDRRLARVVRQCRDLPGYDLFQFMDGDGERQAIGSADVNDYLRDVAGEDFTSKDFRTWAGTVQAFQLLREYAAFKSESQAKKNIVCAVESVARRLGNTRAVCRKCYIHPAVFDAYLDGSMLKRPAPRAPRAAGEPAALTAVETAVLTLLQRQLTREVRRRAS